VPAWVYISNNNQSPLFPARAAQAARVGLVLKNSDHAHEQMEFHGITEEQIKVAVQRGAKTPQTEGFLARYTYQCVAYKMCGDTCVIKTVFMER
jgi:hypothetical protein